MFPPNSRIHITDDLFADPETGTFRGADGTPRRDEPSIAALLGTLIDRSGLSTTAWAQSIDVDPRQVRRWRAGDEVPQLAMRRRLLAMFVGRTVPSPENPVILATLVAGMLRGEPSDETNAPSFAERARKIAAVIDEQAGAARNVREQHGRGV